MRLSTIAVLFSLIGGPAAAAPCGGDFNVFLRAMSAEAAAQGLPQSAIDAFMAGARQDAAVIKADRSQGIFRKTFLEFSQSLISKNRINGAASNSRKFDASFKAATQRYGTPRGIILSFWAFETDFGQVQGDFNTRNALLTLGHDCRRPELFQPQILAGIALAAKGDLDPATTKGAWAGEIGQVQMLPADILERGVDGDGDGHITLKTSAPDAILSASHMLQYHGWRAGEPWMQEVVVPEGLDWSKTGLDNELSGKQWAAMGVQAREGSLANLPASILLPQGRKGPAFIVYPNYKVLFNWNKSFVYVTTAAYFATRIEGAPPYNAGKPDPALSGDAIVALQKKLAAMGYDMGKIDGIIGAATRRAVQAEQKRLGLPADGWPTQALVDAL
jgi:lytic murein transglycosylase